MPVPWTPIRAKLTGCAEMDHAHVGPNPRQAVGLLFVDEQMPQVQADTQVGGLNQWPQAHQIVFPGVLQQQFARLVARLAAFLVASLAPKPDKILQGTETLAEGYAFFRRWANLGGS